MNLGSVPGVPGPSGRLQSVHWTLILNVKPIDEPGKFSNVKKWKFWKSWARSEFRIWSCFECIYLPLKCLPLFIICIKRTYKWIRSVYIYASNGYGMTYTTLRYSLRYISELFKFELYILNRTLKWNKVCQNWKSKIAQTDLNKINPFRNPKFSNFCFGGMIFNENQ